MLLLVYGISLRDNNRVLLLAYIFHSLFSSDIQGHIHDTCNTEVVKIQMVIDANVSSSTVKCRV